MPTAWMGICLWISARYRCLPPTMVWISPADSGRDLPAASRPAELGGAGDRPEVILRQHGVIVVRQDLAFHSAPCNDQTILCNDWTAFAAGGCASCHSVVFFLLVSEL